MKKINISHLRSGLCSILSELDATGSIIVLDRNTPVAVLSPLKGSAFLDHRLVLVRLEGEGELVDEGHPRAAEGVIPSA
jgi:antitoxin (DNA-binding transcriptional repressor) of toxin-antitoxin stability system